ncbi:hypothetical protein Vretifemale_18126, partial [Volvox reticuliferus]
GRWTRKNPPVLEGQHAATTANNGVVSSAVAAAAAAAAPTTCTTGSKTTAEPPPRVPPAIIGLRGLLRGVPLAAAAAGSSAGTDDLPKGLLLPHGENDGEIQSPAAGVNHAAAGVVDSPMDRGGLLLPAVVHSGEPNVFYSSINNHTATPQVKTALLATSPRAVAFVSSANAAAIPAAAQSTPPTSMPPQQQHPCAAPTSSRPETTPPSSPPPSPPPPPPPSTLPDDPLTHRRCDGDLAPGPAMVPPLVLPPRPPQRSLPQQLQPWPPHGPAMAPSHGPAMAPSHGPQPPPLPQSNLPSGSAAPPPLSYPPPRPPAHPLSHPPPRPPSPLPP